MNELDFLSEYLPNYVFEAIILLNENNISEIRIRKGKPITVVKNSTSSFLRINDEIIILNNNEFEKIYLKMCDYSLYCFEKSLKDGYITLKNGSRVGVCSTAVYQNDEQINIKDITSLIIRIPREIKNFSRDAYDKIFSNSPKNVIVVGKVSSGKTTFLRDISRLLSNNMHNVVIIDSRNEIAGKRNDDFTLDVGQNTDILTGFEKKKAIDIAVRTLSPEYIICDEIGTNEEFDEISNGFHSGVNFIISFHAFSYFDLLNKPLLQKAIKSNQFDYIVFLQPEYKYEILKVADVIDEINRLNNDNSLCYCYGYSDMFKNEPKTADL